MADNDGLVVTGEVSEELAYRGQPKAKMELSSHQTVGLRIFYWIIGLAAAGLVLVAVFAWATFPTTAQIRELAGPGATDLLTAQRQARAEWVQQVMSIGQLFFISSFLPLLGTVVGYTLGERKGASAAEK